MKVRTTVLAAIMIWTLPFAIQRPPLLDMVSE
jgi:hypothetical protein